MMSNFHTCTILKSMIVIRLRMFFSLQAQLCHHLFRHNICAPSTIKNHKTYLSMGSALSVEECISLAWFFFLEVNMQTPFDN